MANVSWRQWLQVASRLSFGAKARKRVVAQNRTIEALEDRALLTANLPIAVDDPAYTANEDQLLTGSTVLSNDTDADGDTIDHAVLVANVQHGTLTFNQDGSFTYLPNSNFHGVDSFTYSAVDSAHGETSANAATVTITVNSVNDAPVATSTTVTTSEDTPLNGTVSGTDADQDILIFSRGSISPTHGTLNFRADGTFTYTPNANSHGADAFSFRVNDGSANSAEAIVWVNITSGNDAPIATPTSIVVQKDAAFIGTLNGSDDDNDSLVFKVGGVQPSHGTIEIRPNGSFRYIPTAGYTGSDTFTFKTNDGVADSVEATVTVTVTSVNSAPTSSAGSFETNEDLPVLGNLSGSDPDGDPITFSAGQIVAAHGTVVINPNGTFSYTPFANFFGTDTFSFKVSDATHTSSQSTVTITVYPVNDVPLVADASISTNINTPLVNSVSTLGFDGDGNPLTYSIVTQPAHGTVALSPDGNFTYTPTAGYFGTDSFEFRANDGLVNSNVAKLTITITNVDLPFKVTLPSAPITLLQNGVKARIDPAASVNDPDTAINYSGATIKVTILAGNPDIDFKNNRFKMSVQSQGTGPGQIRVSGPSIFFENGTTPIARITGGTGHKSLLITFTSSATQQLVNAVLKQLSVQASARASLGPRVLGISVTAGGKTTEVATQVATVQRADQ